MRLSIFHKAARKCVLRRPRIFGVHFGQVPTKECEEVGVPTL